MNLKLLKEEFSICKVKQIDYNILVDEYVFIGKTAEEISLVCESSKIPNQIEAIENGWKCFKIEGILDFSLVGIISKISTILANESVGIFVVSTFNTDYFLVKEENIDKAIMALKNNDYIIRLII